MLNKLPLAIGLLLMSSSAVGTYSQTETRKTWPPAWRQHYFCQPDTLAIKPKAICMSWKISRVAWKNIRFANDMNNDSIAESIGKWASLSTKAGKHRFVLQ